MNKVTVSIVIPVFNEDEAIDSVIDVIMSTMNKTGYQYEIIVVDDGSIDETPGIVKKKQGVKLIQHSYNRGVGAARKTGMLAAQGEVIVMTDGDGTYPNQDIPKLLSYIGDYDMVVGARVGKKG